MPTEPTAEETARRFHDYCVQCGWLSPHAPMTFDVRVRDLLRAAASAALEWAAEEFEDALDGTEWRESEVVRWIGKLRSEAVRRSGEAARARDEKEKPNADDS